MGNLLINKKHKNEMILSNFMLKFDITFIIKLLYNAHNVEIIVINEILKKTYVI